MTEQFFTRNSQSKINFKKHTSEYAYPGSNDVVAYIVAAGKGFAAVTSYGDVSADGRALVGKMVAMTVQSDVSFDRTTYRVVVGFIDAGGNRFGHIPTTNLQHYVMK